MPPILSHDMIPLLYPSRVEVHRDQEYQPHWRRSGSQKQRTTSTIHKNGFLISFGLWAAVSE